MRTTITLDKDVASRIKRLRKAGPLKQLVNDALRAGLDVIEQRGAKSKSYSIVPVKGLPRRTDFDNVFDVLDEVERSPTATFATPRLSS